MNIQFNKINIVSYIILIFLLSSTIITAFIFFNTYWGDSSIYLVYARNIAIGDFFSFNPSEFSSGATSPLWAIILSTGFLLGNGVVISKIISLIFVLIALLLTFKTSEVITKSKIGTAISIGFLWYFLAFSGIFLYESGLTVSLISLLLLLNYYLINENKEKYLFYIGILWMALPFVRPETLFVIFFNLILILYSFRNDNMLYKSVAIFIISLIPIGVYFGYSYMNMGILSSSSLSRQYSLSTIANLFPFARFYIFMEFFSFPVVIMGFFIGIYGIITNYFKKCYWLLFFFVSSFLSFIFIFLFYSPITNLIELQRYMVYIIPFIVPFISLGIFRIIKITPKSRIASIIIISLIIITLVILPPVSFINTYNKLNGFGFDDVTEKSAVTYINNIAPFNSTILAFEVQDRYYLRNDLKILSLDGITDGKILPFFIKNDLSGFLWKYKPRYMIVNKAVYLPMYSNSIISVAVNAIKKKEGNSITINGITFKNIKIRDQPLNTEFWGYTEIYELTYS